MSATSMLYDESTNVAIREALPGAAVGGLELATHLGDGAVLVVLGTVLYWFGGEDNRRERAFVIAVGIAALALAAGLKGIFMHPRPEGFAFAPEAYGGYSFPSAHALGAAAFYGAVAAVATTRRRWTRYGIAAVVIVTVALSRVVIGVHYLGDVVAGVALGLLLVGVGLKLGAETPGRVFVLAAVVALSAFALGSREFTSMTIGAALGGAVGWWAVEDVIPQPSKTSILLLGVACLPFVPVLRFVSGEFQIHPSLEMLGFAVATAGIIAVPAVADALDDRPTVRWVAARLPLDR